MSISPQLSLSIEKVFSSLDTDGNGFLDCNELKAGFASMVCTFSKPIPLSKTLHTPHFAALLIARL